MARLKSEDRRNSILSAATQIFAERGLAAPTAAITGAAGVAEGTLFTYFRTKDELVNTLYREIKLELADAMMSGFPRRASVRHRLRHVWDQYVEWGIAHPAQQKVLKQIEVWRGLTEESKTVGSGPFAVIQAIMADAMTQRLVRELPERFIGAAMSALAETAMEFGRQQPKQAEAYRAAGFDILWAGVARKP